MSGVKGVYRGLEGLGEIFALKMLRSESSGTIICKCHYSFAPTF